VLVSGGIAYGPRWRVQQLLRFFMHPILDPIITWTPYDICRSGTAICHKGGRPSATGDGPSNRRPTGGTAVNPVFGFVGNTGIRSR